MKIGLATASPIFLLSTLILLMKNIISNFT